jgi:hypothetical protein
MSRILTRNQKIILFIVGFLAYSLITIIVLLFLILIYFSAVGQKIPEFIKSDLWFNQVVLPLFFFVWIVYILWVIFNHHLNLKQKIIWCLALLAMNIIAFPWFFHHMYRVYKGTINNYSSRTIQSAEQFLVCHDSDKTLLSEQQWQILLQQIKLRQSRKIIVFLSPLLSGFMFYVSIYGYMTLLYIKDTHTLAIPFMNAEIWNSSGPAEQWKFTIMDFGTVCTIGMFFALGILSLINSFIINMSDSKKQLNTLSAFLPKINR